MKFPKKLCFLFSMTIFQTSSHGFVLNEDSISDYQTLQLQHENLHHSRTQRGKCIMAIFYVRQRNIKMCAINSTHIMKNSQWICWNNMIISVWDSQTIFLQYSKANKCLWLVFLPGNSNYRIRAYRMPLLIRTPWYTLW